MSKISDLVEYHIKKEKICYKEVRSDCTLYHMKSISRSNACYILEEKENKWYCDCKSFKYKTGTNEEGDCKHIIFVKFLKENNQEIESV